VPKKKTVGQRILVALIEKYCGFHVNNLTLCCTSHFCTVFGASIGSLLTALCCKPQGQAEEAMISYRDYSFVANHSGTALESAPPTSFWSNQYKRAPFQLASR
jgi:hypothetical protein